MADARAPMDVRHVILPWAQTASPDDSFEGAARDRVAQDAAVLRITDDRFAIRKDGVRPESYSRSSMRRDLLEPPLRAVGLPYKPHPSVPDEDRRPMTEDAIVSVAVALDVLATLTRKLEPRPTLLADLAVVLQHVGTLGGIDAPAVERLLEHAASSVGRGRAHLAHELAAHMQEAVTSTSDTDGDRPVVQPTTPTAVAQALRRIERTADCAVREARLRLDAHEAIEYRQA